MHPSYFNDTRIRDAWQQQHSMCYLEGGSIRDRLIRQGAIRPANNVRMIRKEWEA